MCKLVNGEVSYDIGLTVEEEISVFSHVHIYTFTHLHHG
jgi:hypothetical protein